MNDNIFRCMRLTKLHREFRIIDIDIYIYTYINFAIQLKYQCSLNNSTYCLTKYAGTKENLFSQISIKHVLDGSTNAKDIYST